MVDPIVSTGRAIAGAAIGARNRRRGNASNVVLVAEAVPRQIEGYRLRCTVNNGSPVGISDIAIRVSMNDGELDLGSGISRDAVLHARRALPAGDALEVEFPHVVRFGERTFDVGADVGAGFSATLFWRDDAGKRWCRTDGGFAKRCRAQDYPAVPR